MSSFEINTESGPKEEFIMSVQDALKNAFDVKKEEAQNDNQSESGRDDGLPEKYQGKSKEEVVEMHRNVEKRLAQQGQEVGELRGRIDELSRQSAEKYGVEEAQVPDKNQIIDEVIESLPEDSLEMEPGQLVRTITDAVDQITELRLKDFEETRVRPLQEQSISNEATNVVRQVASQYSDFDDFVEDIREVIQKPVYQDVLLNAKMDEKVAMLDDIYHMVKGRSNGQSNRSANNSTRLTKGSQQSPGNSVQAEKEKLGNAVRKSIVGRGR